MWISGFLSNDRIEKPDTIGIIRHDIFDFNREENYTVLKEYQIEHSNIDICVGYVTDSGIPLGTWLSNPRAWKAGGVKKCYVKSECIRQLGELGMIWEKDDLWQARYCLAKVYYDESGTLAGMPADYALNDIWVN